MSLSNASETALALLLFQNVAMANIGNSGGLQPSTSAGYFYIALHTQNPTSSGTQSSYEAAYTGYARVAVARSSAGWIIAGNQPTSISNAAVVTFPVSNGNPETETYFSIGTASVGAGQILISGALTTPVYVSVGITPIFAIGSIVTTLT